jgi:hypothetical protein
MKFSYGGLFFIMIIVAIIIFNSVQKSINGFQNYNITQWSPDLIKRFNNYQSTMNANINQFNLEILQKQASPEEAEEYLKNGIWTWTDDLKNMYLEKVQSSPIIQIDPHYALNYAMKLYNKNAVTELLAWNTKEGHFLLYGGDLGLSGTIKCSPDANNSLVKTVYTGMNLWNGYMNSTTTNIKPEDIPKEMTGFRFVNNACNPCIAFADATSENYSCPFRLNVKGDDTISEPWKKIWKLN